MDLGYNSSTRPAADGGLPPAINTHLPVITDCFPFPYLHNTTQTSQPCLPADQTLHTPAPPIHLSPIYIKDHRFWILPPDSSAAPPNRSPPRCRGRDLRCFNLGVDGGGGGGAGGERAGRSLPAPLRHRPHAPVSPPPIPQRSSCRGDFLGAASRWALVDCFAAK
jgi:hypothetical protein